MIFFAEHFVTVDSFKFISNTLSKFEAGGVIATYFNFVNSENWKDIGNIIIE